MVKGEVHRKHLVERTSSPFASSVLSCAKEKEKKKSSITTSTGIGVNTKSRVSASPVIK